jgi:hypothetical protein
MRLQRARRGEREAAVRPVDGRLPDDLLAQRFDRNGFPRRARAIIAQNRSERSSRRSSMSSSSIAWIAATGRPLRVTMIKSFLAAWSVLAKWFRASNTVMVFMLLLSVELGRLPLVQHRDDDHFRLCDMVAAQSLDPAATHAIRLMAQVCLYRVHDHDRRLL